MATTSFLFGVQKEIFTCEKQEMVIISNQFLEMEHLQLILVVQWDDSNLDIYIFKGNFLSEGINSCCCCLLEKS